VGVPFDQEVTVSIFVSQDKGKTFKGPEKKYPAILAGEFEMGHRPLFWMH
jgi:hypothetical protein